MEIVWGKEANEPSPDGMFKVGAVVLGGMQLVAIELPPTQVVEMNNSVHLVMSWKQPHEIGEAINYSADRIRDDIN